MLILTEYPYCSLPPASAAALTLSSLTLGNSSCSLTMKGMLIHCHDGMEMVMKWWELDCKSSKVTDNYNDRRKKGNFQEIVRRYN